MKAKAYVYWKQEDWEREPRPVIFMDDISGTSLKGYVFTGTIEVDLPEPTHTEWITAKVSELRQRQGALQAEITKIDGKIQELCCIEYKEAA